MSKLPDLVVIEVDVGGSVQAVCADIPIVAVVIYHDTDSLSGEPMDGIDIVPHPHPLAAMYDKANVEKALKELNIECEGCGE